MESIVVFTDGMRTYNNLQYMKDYNNLLVLHNETIAWEYCMGILQELNVFSSK